MRHGGPDVVVLWLLVCPCCSPWSSWRSGCAASGAPQRAGSPRPSLCGSAGTPPCCGWPSQTSGEHHTITLLWHLQWNDITITSTVEWHHYNIHSSLVRGSWRYRLAPCASEFDTGGFTSLQRNPSTATSDAQGQRSLTRWLHIETFWAFIPLANRGRETRKYSPQCLLSNVFTLTAKLQWNLRHFLTQLHQRVLVNS